MPSLIRKLFHKSEAPNDGLTQPQREAIVDLLNYCMYADNLVMLAEDRLIADTVAKFNWDSKVPFDQFDKFSGDRHVVQSAPIPFQAAQPLNVLREQPAGGIHILGRQ